MGAIVAIAILVPVMSFVWILIELARQSKRAKRAEAELELTTTRYEYLKKRIIEAAKKEALEAVEDLRAMAKEQKA